MPGFPFLQASKLQYERYKRSTKTKRRLDYSFTQKGILITGNAKAIGCITIMMLHNTSVVLIKPLTNANEGIFTRLQNEHSS